MMTSFSRVRLALAFVLLAGSPLAGQTPNFSKYVALGDSYGAGFGSGCLVAREQHFSYPNTIAKQLGNVDFQQPTVSDPGIPICNTLLSIAPVTFGPISTHLGMPTNLALARPYDNLSVPGFKIADVSDKLTDSGGLADLILRGQGSALNQALSLSPTFVTLGIIGNDILTAGGAGFLLDGVTATPLPVFTAKYNAVAASLQASGRTGVFLGTPYLAFIPLASTIPPVVINPATNQPVLDQNGNPIPLLGPGNTAFPCPVGALGACPLPAGTLVTLGASAPQAALGGKSLLQLGFGIPCAVNPTLPQCDKPLPDGGFVPPSTVNLGVLLYPDEVAAIDQRVRDMNAVIKSAAEANGFKYFDFYAFSQGLIANGFDIGGMHFTTKFVTGGMFAFGEAVHMSNIGYTILADGIIQFINASYGTSVSRPDFHEAIFTADVPAAGTTAISGWAATELFNEASWRNLFVEFPLQKSSFELVLPGIETSVERGPVVRVAPRGRRD
jgi:hypothetical protein